MYHRKKSRPSVGWDWKYSPSPADTGTLGWRRNIRGSPLASSELRRLSVCRHLQTQRGGGDTGQGWFWLCCLLSPTGGQHCLSSVWLCLAVHSLIYTHICLVMDFLDVSPASPLCRMTWHYWHSGKGMNSPTDPDGWGWWRGGARGRAGADCSVVMPGNAFQTPLTPTAHWLLTLSIILPQETEGMAHTHTHLFVQTYRYKGCVQLLNKIKIWTLFEWLSLTCYPRHQQAPVRAEPLLEKTSMRSKKSSGYSRVTGLCFMQLRGETFCKQSGGWKCPLYGGDFNSGHKDLCRERPSVNIIDHGGSNIVLSPCCTLLPVRLVSCSTPLICLSLSRLD